MSEKEEEKKRVKLTKERVILYAFFGTLTTILVFFTIVGWIVSIYLTIPAILAGVVLIYFGLAGLKTFSPEERAVIELLGSFEGIREGGLHWVCPFFMEIRAVVGIWVQQVKLFESPLKIDFLDGSATPKGVVAFVQVKSPDKAYRTDTEDPMKRTERTGVYRCIYEVSDWRELLRELIENAVRSYLSTLTIDQALEAGKAGFNLLNGRIEQPELEQIEETLSRWGLKLVKVTIADFDLEPELVKARGLIQVRVKEEEAAKHVKGTRSLETMGTLLEMLAVAEGVEMEVIQERIAGSKALQKKIMAIAQDLTERRMSINGQSLTDIRVNGGGDLMNSLISLLAVAKSSLGGKAPPKKQEEKPSSDKKETSSKGGGGKSK